jgi:tRNA (guanine10-N2)-dimethyltransferase
VYCLELGGNDDPFAAAEAGVAAADVSVVAPGLATARVLDRARARTLAYTHRASRVVARTDAALDAATAALQAAPLDVPTERPDGTPTTVAVRARDVRSTTGVDTQRAERALGSVLVERGFAVDLDDPDRELRATFAGDLCLLGWLVAESVRDYGDRKPTDRPFFQPGSMDPLLARALVNLARVAPGECLLDPMCGTGGVCIEAGLVGATPIGTDAQAKMARGARENLAHVLAADPPPYASTAFHVARADATRLPVRDGSVDAVVFDAPYGRQSKIATHDLADLVEGALSEARRVAAGRAVLVADRDWRDAARAAGWSVASRFVRRVHRSLDRHVLVLD